MKVATIQAFKILTADLDSVGVKRLAWAFGCSKKDSEEEAELYRRLVEKLDRIKGQRA